MSLVASERGSHRRAQEVERYPKMNKVPLMKSTSWADVEDEFPPSPPRAPLPPANNPTSLSLTDSASVSKITRIETRPGQASAQQHGQARRNDQPRQHRQAPASGQPRPRSEGEPRSLWEPSKPATGQQGSWRSGKSVEPTTGGKGGGGDKPKKGSGGGNKSNNKPRDRKPRQAMFELLIKFAPKSATEDEIRKAFGLDDKIKRVKLVGDDRAFVEFVDKASMDQALTVTLPRWGGKDANVSVAPPQNSGESKKKTTGSKPASSGEGQPVEAKSAVPSSTPREGTTNKNVPAQVKKKPAVTEAKRTNAFAALDTDTETDEDDDDEEEEDEVGESDNDNQTDE